MLQDLTPVDVLTILALVEAIVILALLLGGRRVIIRLLSHVLALVETDEGLPLDQWTAELESLVRASLPPWARLLVGPAKSLVHWAWHELQAHDPDHVISGQPCPYVLRSITNDQVKAKSKRQKRAQDGTGGSERG